MHSMYQASIRYEKSKKIQCSLSPAVKLLFIYLEQFALKLSKFLLTPIVVIASHLHTLYGVVRPPINPSKTISEHVTVIATKQKITTTSNLIFL